MATKKAIQRIKTKTTAKKVFKKTPIRKVISKAKATSDFYGTPIRKGALHKSLNVAQGNIIPISTINKKLNALKKKKNKTAKDIKLERELVYAKNSKTKWGKK